MCRVRSSSSRLVSTRQSGAQPDGLELHTLLDTNFEFAKTTSTKCRIVFAGNFSPSWTSGYLDSETICYCLIDTILEVWS
jgi:hypothetical protein